MTILGFVLGSALQLHPLTVMQVMAKVRAENEPNTVNTKSMKPKC